VSFYRQIQVFRTVMTSTSLAEAASRLFLTQPAVTKQIKGLEARLGIELFSREGHRLQPNDLAQALFEDSSVAVAAMQNLERDALRLREAKSQPIRIVAMPMVARLWLPQRVGQLFELAPGAEFKIRVARSERIVEMLANGLAEIGIGMLNKWNADLHTELLFSPEAVAILPMGHDLSTLKRITPANLEREDFFLLGEGSPIRQDILDAFSISGIRPKIKAEIELEETTVALVEAGLGVSVIDSFSANQRRLSGSQIHIVPFEPTISAHIGAMQSHQTRGNTTISSAFRVLLTS